MSISADALREFGLHADADIGQHSDCDDWAGWGYFVETGRQQAKTAFRQFREAYAAYIDENLIVLQAVTHHTMHDTSTPVADEATRALFEHLVDRWRDETLLESSMDRIVGNMAYSQIIALGPVAIRLILERWQREPAYWFWAMVALVRQDVAAGEETVEGARQAWLRWARTQRLI